jgi:NADPH-dependent glutamate synthase beta subunit-like oxidoreductase
MPSIRGSYACSLIEDYQKEVARTSPEGALPRVRVPNRPTSEPISVGIIGAGAAGLYAALLLQWLAEKHEFKVSFTIHEANAYIGGRLHTIKLGDGDNNYYVCSFYYFL